MKSYRKQVVMDGRPAVVEILDTAGQEEYTALRDQWIKQSEGFLICYSISSRSSFRRIPRVGTPISYLPSTYTMHHSNRPSFLTRLSMLNHTRR